MQFIHIGLLQVKYWQKLLPESQVIYVLQLKNFPTGIYTRRLSELNFQNKLPCAKNWPTLKNWGKSTVKSHEKLTNLVERLLQNLSS